MGRERKTYASTEAVYELDPTQIFNVVEDLNVFMRDAMQYARAENPDFSPNARVVFRGEGKRLVLFTETVSESTDDVRTRGFDLAELVLSEDNNKLTLATHHHPRVQVPSNGLKCIGEKYTTK